MKNFFKKLAFVLALAMIVSTIAPAVSASAAAAPSLNRTSKKLYLNGDVTGTYSNKIDLNVKNKGNNTVTYSTSDATIATVNAASGVVTAKAVGYVEVKATLKDKTTKKTTTTLTCRIWVKQNADGLGFGSQAVLDNALVVGEKAKINVYRSLNGVKYWKQADKTVVTDAIKWTTSNPSVVTVDKWGTFKAVGAGEATITAYAFQTEGSTRTTEAKSFTVRVVDKGITKITQTKNNTIEITFGSDVSEVVTAETLQIASASGSVQTPIVKTVTFDSSKKVATVVFYNDMEDKAVYTVSVKDNKDINGEFVASVGEVNSITITAPSTVLENGNATEIEYDLKDANGVIVNAGSNSRVEFEIVDGDSNGYITTEGNKSFVSVFDAGKTVAIKATYYTGEYTEDGTAIAITSNTYVVKGIAATDVAISDTKYTITKDAYSEIDWKNYTTNSQIALGDTTYKIQAYVKDSAGNEFTTNDSDFTSNFEFESLNTSIVEVDANGVLYPVTKGTAYVKVTLTESTKSFLVKVTVGAERSETTLAFDKYTATVSSQTGVDDEVVFTATLKDQYGDKMTPDFDIVANGTTDSSTISQFTPDGNKLTFDPAGLDAGSYSYKITCGDLSRTVTIIVKDPDTNGATKYSFVVSNNTVDLAATEDSSEGVEVTFSLYTVDAKGIKISKVTPSTGYTIAVKNPSGSTMTSVAIDDNNYVLPILTVSGSSLVKNSEVTAKKGTFSVTVTADDKTITKSSVVISDSQVKPVVKQEETSVSVNGSYTLAQILENKDVFSVSTKNDGTVNEDAVFEGLTVTVVSAPSGYSYDADSTLANGTYKFVIKTVDVKETFENGNSFVHTGVSVNKTVTITVK